jgi:small acid-soluble spore protein D (minor alpha/beta-type SASP)
MGTGQKRNRILVPEANQAMYQFKYEVAQEVGIQDQIQNDYWGC